eukprot:IDg22254t1
MLVRLDFFGGRSRVSWFILQDGKTVAKHTAFTPVLFSGLELTVQSISLICGFSAYFQERLFLVR